MIVNYIYEKKLKFKRCNILSRFFHWRLFSIHVKLMWTEYCPCRPGPRWPRSTLLQTVSFGPGGIFLCDIKKNCNVMYVIGKVQRSSAPLLQLFCALYATAVSLGSNAVKLQVWKVKNTLKSKYVINFFEHLNDLK